MATNRRRWSLPFIIHEEDEFMENTDMDVTDEDAMITALLDDFADYN